MTKTYQHKNTHNFTTPVVLPNGARVFVHFKNGGTQPVPRKSFFVTDVKEIQEALENDKGFNTQFILLSTEGEEAKQEEVPEVPKAVAGPEVPQDGPVEVPEVQSVTQAKDWLIENVEGTKISQLSNKQKVLEYAREKGYSFPALEAE